MTGQPMVLILTQLLDSHADLVIRELHRRHVRVSRFNTADFPMRSTLVARHTSCGTWEGELRVDQHLLSLQEITSIWYRRPTPFEIDPTLPPAAQQFAQAEARMAIGGVLRSLPVLWVNHPEKMVAADYKPYQLKIASNCGLQTPETLLTNAAHAARQFLEAHPAGIIYKTLSGALIFSESGEPLSIYTSRVSLQDLEQQDSIHHTVCLFQEEIPKELELRITVIGKQVFAAAIFSQHSPRTQVDFRQAYADLRYGVYTLPQVIHDRCLALTKALGLSFAAIDMVLTPDHRYVFLELNSSGQWAWIEQATGLPLCETLVNLLTETRKGNDEHISMEVGA